MKLFDFWIVRFGLAFWIALQVLNGVFDGVFVLSYKFHALGITQLLGLRTEGDDYRRFIPLMNGTPMWEPAVSFLGSAFYLAAMVQILKRHRSATGLFFAGLVLSAVPWVHILATPAVQAFSVTHLRRDALLYVITALIGMWLWEGNKSPQPSPQ